jgi:hypothetical protein
MRCLNPQMRSLHSVQLALALPATISNSSPRSSVHAQLTSPSSVTALALLHSQAHRVQATGSPAALALLPALLARYQPPCLLHCTLLWRPRLAAHCFKRPVTACQARLCMRAVKNMQAERTVVRRQVWQRPVCLPGSSTSVCFCPVQSFGS